MGKFVGNPKLRKYLYRLASTACLILAAYGYIADNKVALWNLLFVALFGLADVNVPDTNVNDNADR